MKILKDLGVFLLMVAMMFAIMYIFIITADAEYEVSLEKERIYFDQIEKMRK